VPNHFGMPPRKPKLTAAKANGRAPLALLANERARVKRGHAQTFAGIEAGFLKTMTELGA
jgi:hypothetical protein